MLYVSDEQNECYAEQSSPENAVLSLVKHCFLWGWHNLAEVSDSFPTSSLFLLFWNTHVPVAHGISGLNSLLLTYPGIFFLYPTPSVHRSRPGV